MLVTKKQKIRISYDEYDEIVEKVTEFGASIWTPPEIGEISLAQLLSDPEKTLPKLLYFADVYPEDDKEFAPVKKHIRQMLHNNLEMYDPSDPFPEEKVQVISITYDEYDQLVEDAEKIAGFKTLPEGCDPKYLMTDYTPTVDDLRNHDVEHHLQQFLPLLIYYAEVFESNDPEYEKVRSYIHNILRSHLDVYDPEEEPGKRSTRIKKPF